VVRHHERRVRALALFEDSNFLGAEEGPLGALGISIEFPARHPPYEGPQTGAAATQGVELGPPTGGEATEANLRVAGLAQVRGLEEPGKPPGDLPRIAYRRHNLPRCRVHSVSEDGDPGTYRAVFG
jgi:hypothetical protein